MSKKTSQLFKLFHAPSLVLQVAGLNHQNQAPAADTAAVWLYNEIIPHQIISEQQAATLLRIISLSQCSEVPETLIEQSLNDVRLMFAALTV
ncbi:MAG: hypothetical protein V3U88_08455 [Methylococcales bacterium]